MQLLHTFVIINTIITKSTNIYLLIKQRRNQHNNRMLLNYSYSNNKINLSESVKNTFLLNTT